MKTFETSTKSFAVAVDYPVDWHFAEKPVPKLVVPRQLFAISNRPIQLTPKTTSQPRPMIRPLDPRAIFLWAYYQAPGDPGPEYEDKIPDYSNFSYPLRYREAEVFSSYNAREWDAAKFSWRRVGYDASGTMLTVWVWEGTQASPMDVATTGTIISTVRVRELG